MGMPAWVQMHEAISQTPTKGAARAMLLAALRWVNAAGQLWPSLQLWAAHAGMTDRAARRVPSGERVPSGNKIIAKCEDSNDINALKPFLIAMDYQWRIIPMVAAQIGQLPGK